MRTVDLLSSLQYADDTVSGHAVVHQSLILTRVTRFIVHLCQNAEHILKLRHGLHTHSDRGVRAVSAHLY
jgi:hypothetical protein